MSDKQRYFRYSPFKRLKVTVSDIDFDLDGMSPDEVEQTRGELPTSGTLDYAADELFDNGVLSEDENTGTDWVLDRDALEELVSDRIISDSEFCHNGFNFSFSIVN